MGEKDPLVKAIEAAKRGKKLPKGFRSAPTNKISTAAKINRAKKLRFVGKAGVAATMLSVAKAKRDRMVRGTEEFRRKRAEETRFKPSSKKGGPAASRPARKTRQERAVRKRGLRAVPVN